MLKDRYYLVFSVLILLALIASVADLSAQSLAEDASVFSESGPYTSPGETLPSDMFSMEISYEIPGVNPGPSFERNDDRSGTLFVMVALCILVSSALGKTSDSAGDGIADIFVGDTFQCTGRLDNTSTEAGGPFPVSNVVLSMFFPTSFQLQGFIPPTGASCDSGSGSTVCTFPTFPANGVVDIDFEFIASLAGIFEVGGAFTQNDFDPNLNDNQDSVPVTILEIPTGNDFHIRKFWDQDEDGDDTDEFGVDDVVFNLSTTGGDLVQSQTSMSMDFDESGDIDPFSETGWVWFIDIPDGEYVLTEVVPDGYSSTNPNGNSMNIQLPIPLEITHIPWGNTGPVDWGDLPDPGVLPIPCSVPGGCYETLSARNGPSHLIQPMPFMLGASIDGEADGQPSRLADGDGADEDGLEDLFINPDGSITMDVRVTDPKGQVRFLDVFLDVNGNYIFDLPTEAVVVAHPMDPNTVTTITTAPLGYDVDELIGYLRLRLSSTGGLAPTGPFGDGEVEDYVDYGVDWGDLPDPRIGLTDPCPLADDCYRTTDANDGPSHIFLRGDPVLGYQIDDEPDGQPDALAQGDDASPTAPFIDYNPGADTGDEDGLMSVNIEENGSVTLEVFFSDPNGFGGVLDVWIDLDDDGYLAYGGDGSGRVAEDVVIAQPLSVGPNIINTGILNPPLLPDEGLGYMRMRLSQSGVPTPYDSHDDGEVEDYYFPATDFGDAPEEMDPDFPDIPYGYPTTRANNGAMHLASQASKIGPESDGESNGQPTTLADGDDNSSKDDEDGVLFDGDVLPLSFKLTTGSDALTTVPGLIVGESIKMIVSPSRSGKIDAWMDWNADGDWEDNGEKVFSREMVNPPSDTLFFVVPENATAGFSFARVRYSLNGSDSFDGEADDGEVEDYMFYSLTFDEVNSDADTGDATPGDGICDDGTGNCTLRAAMEETNASGRPRIFTVPGSGKRAVVLQPTTPYPVITSPFLIDGGGELEIDGSLAGASANGFEFEVGGSALVGTLIHSFGGDAVRVTGDKVILDNNVIRDNGGSGVVIVSGSENQVRTSTIFNNGGLGIDLGDDGVTLNDLDDADTGANGLLNFPELTSVTAEDGSITGTFSSVPNTSFVLDFFSSPTCNASGYGGGAVYLGSALAQTDGGGNADFVFEATAAPILIGDAITATASDEAGNSSEFSQCQVAITTSIERNADSEVPEDFVLHQNYPNPFNPVTNITFGLSKAEFVTVEVFDILGKKVETLVSEWKEQGEFTVTFDASDLPSGIYLYRMTAGSFSSAKQLTLLK